MRTTRTMLFGVLISCASGASAPESPTAGGETGSVAQGAPVADLHVLLEIQGMT